MITSVIGIAFDYNAYVIDGSNDPVDLSTAAIWVTLIHRVSGATVGPIAGAASASPGHVAFPLSIANTSESGVYDVVINYTDGPTAETTFSGGLTLVARPPIVQIPVLSATLSTVIFSLTNADGTPINITGKTVLLYTQVNHSVPPLVLVSHTVIDAVNGIVSADFTTAVVLYGHFLVDAALTSEFTLTPVV